MGSARDGAMITQVWSEHVEAAGVHSGDATPVQPPQRIYIETAKRVRRLSGRIARSLPIHGPFNIHFIALEGEVPATERNPRASIA